MKSVLAPRTPTTPSTPAISLERPAWLERIQGEPGFDSGLWYHWLSLAIFLVMLALALHFWWVNGRDRD